MNENFIRTRLTELRLKKGISEYKMSTDLGHSKSYIQSISSGRALPSLSEFLYICEYLQVSPHDFFDEGNNNPILINEINEKIKNMNENDLQLILTIINRLTSN